MRSYERPNRVPKGPVGDTSKDAQVGPKQAAAIAEAMRGKKPATGAGGMRRQKNFKK